MKIFVPKEEVSHETRVSLLPQGIKKLTSLEASVIVEKEIGQTIHIPDLEYEKSGAAICANKKRALAEADAVIRLNPPEPSEIKLMKKGAVHVSLMDPFNNPDLLSTLVKKEISAFSLELIPRLTITQKMDVLSSQANAAGYASIIIASAHLGKILPMMMTPAGTLPPAHIFVIGAGVAGLQAIATAKRLGARVEAFDTRPVVAEQVESLGAKFLKIDLGKTGQTESGYAKELSEEQLQRQREMIAKACARADIIVATAKVFGKKAPLIVTKDALERLKSGSVLVDLAADQGGNIEGTRLHEVVEYNGVKIIGYENCARLVPESASAMFSNNLTSFVEHIFGDGKGGSTLNLQDEIISSSLVTREGKIVNSLILERNQ